MFHCRKKVPGGASLESNLLQTMCLDQFLFSSVFIFWNTVPNCSLHESLNLVAGLSLHAKRKKCEYLLYMLHQWKVFWCFRFHFKNYKAVTKLKAHCEIQIIFPRDSKNQPSQPESLKVGGGTCLDTILGKLGLCVN